MDEGFAGKRLLQLCTQLADVDVDGALLLAEWAIPDDGVELFTADDAAAAARQCGQQAELPDRQGDRAPVRQRDELRRPDLQPALRQDFVRRCFHREAEHRRKGRKVRYRNVTVL